MLQYDTITVSRFTTINIQTLEGLVLFLEQHRILYLASNLRWASLGHHTLLCLSYFAARCRSTCLLPRTRTCVAPHCPSTPMSRLSYWSPTCLYRGDLIIAGVSHPRSSKGFIIVHHTSAWYVPGTRVNRLVKHYISVLRNFNISAGNFQKPLLVVKALVISCLELRKLLTRNSNYGISLPGPPKIRCLWLDGSTVMQYSAFHISHEITPSNIYYTFPSGRGQYT